MFTMTKVFDVTDMPINMRESLREFWDDLSNGKLIFMDIPQTSDELPEIYESYGTKHAEVVEWLLANGAEYGDKDVAIHYWW